MHVAALQYVTGGSIMPVPLSSILHLNYIRMSNVYYYDLRELHFSYILEITNANRNC